MLAPKSTFNESEFQEFEKEFSNSDSEQVLSDDEDEDEIPVFFENQEASDSEDDPIEPIPLSSKLKIKSTPASGIPGVVFLGRIPHGFYEKQMLAYFSQFGKVLRLRLSRNKKTGASKHYAFIEFQHDSVANVVAETMNNYLLFSHLLKCKVVDPKDLHPSTFIGANRKFKTIPWAKIDSTRRARVKSLDEITAIQDRLILRDDKKRQAIKAMGMDYDFVGYQK